METRWPERHNVAEHFHKRVPACRGKRFAASKCVSGLFIGVARKVPSFDSA